MINYQKNILANGLRVILAPIKETKAVTVMVLVGAGSRYETYQQSGLAHFLEHMVFKGTSRRPTTLDISGALDAVGASFNAFTGEEETGFYVRVEKSHFSLALDVLEDILFNSKFEQDEINKEKGVILEEINMYQDTPQSHVENLSKEQFYGDTPLGRPITGRSEIVKTFSKKNFIDFHDSFYTPDNMVIVVSGADSRQWLKEISHKFGYLKGFKKTNWIKNHQSQSKPCVHVSYKATDQAHLIVGVRTFSRHHKLRPTLKVINNILGDTMSSRLFTEVREKRGLAYYVGTDFSEFHDVGSLCASAGVDTKRFKEAIEVILGEFSKIKNKGVSNKELAQAKDNIRGRFYLGLEDSFSVANFLADQELLWGKIKSPEQILQEVNKVTISDIMQLSDQIFQPKNLNLTFIGPYHEKKEFEKILKI